MKKQTTQKYIKSIKACIVRIGACDMQYLLAYQEPSYYTAGIYGWNCDIYFLPECAIATGYRPFGNVKPSYELVRKYDDAASDVISDADMTEDERRNAVDDLLHEFIYFVLSDYYER